MARTGTQASLTRLCEARILAHTQDRDVSAAKVAEALGHVQPYATGLAAFLEAVEHAYAVEAWTQVLKREPDSAWMTMYHWMRTRTSTPHPVMRLIESTKCDVAHAVVEELTMEGFLDERALRIVAIGIWALD